MPFHFPSSLPSRCVSLGPRVIVRRAIVRAIRIFRPYFQTLLHLAKKLLESRAVAATERHSIITRHAHPPLVSLVSAPRGLPRGFACQLPLLEPVLPKGARVFVPHLDGNQKACRASWRHCVGLGEHTPFGSSSAPARAQRAQQGQQGHERTQFEKGSTRSTNAPHEVGAPVARVFDEVVAEDTREEPCREAAPKRYERLLNEEHINS